MLHQRELGVLKRYPLVRVIVEDPVTSVNIRSVFARILPEEIFHERAFAKMAGEKALKETEGAHDLGMEALGLAV